jgi:hypothetical protein
MLKFIGIVGLFAGIIGTIVVILNLIFIVPNGYEWIHSGILTMGKFTWGIVVLLFFLDTCFILDFWGIYLLKNNQNI